MPDCPVRSFERQPSSCVHPFSPPGYGVSDDGLEKSALAAWLVALDDGSKSWMWWKLRRDVQST